MVQSIAKFLLGLWKITIFIYMKIGTSAHFKELQLQPYECIW